MMPQTPPDGEASTGPLPGQKDIEYAPATFLLATDQAYVKVLRRAVALLACSALSTIPGSDLLYATSWIGQYSGNNAPFSMLVTSLSYLLQAVGVWFLTSYQPHNMHSAGHAGIRWMTRWTGIAAAACLLLTGPASWFDIRRQTGLLPLGLAEFLCASTCKIGTVYLLRLVALDIPSRPLATNTIWLICGLVVGYVVYLIGKVEVLAIILAFAVLAVFQSDPLFSAAFNGLRNARFACQAFSLWLTLLLFLLYRALGRQITASAGQAR